jgi:acyl carrier protein
MTIGNLSSKQETKAMHQISTANDVRTIIAKHLGVEVKRVTDEAHFTYDLGADWLDRLELMIVIEDQFPAVEITDDDVDRIEVVGDLIHHIKRAWAVGDDDAPIIETPLQ